jgi:hypothetical protein
MQTVQQRIEEVLRRSPFMHSSLPPSQLEQDSTLFLQMFGLAAETINDQEQEWAYLKMKDAYIRLLSSPPVDPERELPRGLWEAMNWAAELRSAMSRLSSTPSSR